MRKVIVLTIIILLLFLGGCNSQDVIRVDLSKTSSEVMVDRPNPPRQGVYYFGFDRRLEIKEDVKMYVPFLRYLEKKTGYQFKLHITPRNKSIVDELGNGVVQFAAVGTVSYLQAQEKYGVKSLVRGLGENDGLYQAVIITRLDSDIKGINDLRGRSFAFGSRNSTQGHLIPRIMLAEAGIGQDSLSRYEFTGSHAEVANAVMSGQFDAGGLQDTLARALASRGLVRIVAKSKFYPSSGISVHPDVDPEVVAAVKKALIEFDPNGQDREGLYHWDQSEMPNGFMESREEDYQELKRWAEIFYLLN
ncbi:phosphate/phosphite/phosphonate ABC transporter substrate-binding protein [Clostridiales bacterium PH28_bin88]|nr:phosphate/phosphite/phosphonate ABC transporter substrate-binding protein [Clostridiales bacterium PH28_bin88]